MRPIDADALIESMSEGWDWWAEDKINDAPTLDVETVRRGKWIKKGSKILLCTNCLCAALFRSGSTVCLPSPYCPNCGAKMEVE